MLDLDPQLMHMRDNIGASLAHYAASGGHEGVLEFLDVKVPELVRFWSSSLIFSCSWDCLWFTACHVSLLVVSLFPCTVLSLMASSLVSKLTFPSAPLYSARCCGHERLDSSALGCKGAHTSHLSLCRILSLSLYGRQQQHRA
jgi:hypothetical protein